MERAQAVIVPARLAKLDVRADEVHDVRGLTHAIDKVL